MDTLVPTRSGKPGSVCRTAPSCTLLLTPMLMVSLSPRKVAANHTLLRSARTTLPTIVALGAMYALAAMVGETSANLYRAIPPPIIKRARHRATLRCGLRMDWAIIDISDERDPNIRHGSTASMAVGFGAPVAVESGAIGTVRQSDPRNARHGRGMAHPLGVDRPLAIRAGPAIFSRRSSTPCLVRAGDFGFGRLDAMADGGTGVCAHARREPGRRAAAAAVRGPDCDLSRSDLVLGHE